MTASQKLGEAMYAQAQAEAGRREWPGGSARRRAAGSGDEAKGGEEKVVDAEFTEVKDKK